MPVTADPQSGSLQQALDHMLAGLVRPANLLVAVSGGSDSLGLLIGLHEAIRQDDAGGVTLCAATVDHGLRSEAADEALSVQRLCEGLGIPHFIRRWGEPKPKAGVSAAAREARYRLLMDVADEAGATAILTGHTRDDQHETVAMRSARAAGESNLGLAGMAPMVLLDRRLWLLRPLLAVSRREIRDFLRVRNRVWIDDPSNLDDHYERVRLRKALASGQVSDDAAIAEAGLRRQELSEAAADLAQQTLSLRHGVLARFSPAALAAPQPVLRHCLSLLAAVLGGRAHAMPAEMMDRVMTLVDLGKPGRMTAGRVIFDLRRDGLYLSREIRGLSAQACAGGATICWDGRFSITNHGTGEIVIGPTPPDKARAAMLFPDVTASIAQRAMTAMPHYEGSLRACGPVDINPALGPFERFLSQFDLAIAEKIAALLECDSFPAPPIKLSARKS